MKAIYAFRALLTGVFFVSALTTFSQNTYPPSGTVSIGSSTIGSNTALTINGPNSPTNSASFQDINFKFVAAGSAKIRSYRGGGWDTYLQFLTNQAGANGDNPQVAMHINGDGNVGIGTNTPTGLFELQSSGTNLASYATSYTNGAGSPSLVGQKARGSVGSPTAATLNDYLFTIAGRGYHSGGAFASNSSGTLRFQATQAFTPTAQGTAITFETTLNGTVNRTEAMRIDHNGNIGIGTTSPGALLTLHRSGAGLPQFRLEDGDINIPNYSAVGFNPLPSANTVGTVSGLGSTIGGMQINGFSNMTDPRAMRIVGNSGSAATTNAVIGFDAWKHDGGTSRTALAATDIVFDFNSGTSNLLRIMGNGNVGIGTTDPKEYKLAVKGSAIFTKVQVKASSTVWPDYVFNEAYKLRSLSSLESYINKHNHLPDVPSAKEVEKEGLDLAATQAILLKKIEELTLYVVQMDKEIKELKSRKAETLGKKEL